MNDNILEVTTRLQAGKVADSGYFYPKDVLIDAMDKFKQKVKSTKVFGYFDDQYYISPNERNKEERAFRILDVNKTKDDRFKLKIKPLDNKNGNKVKELVYNKEHVSNVHCIGDVEDYTIKNIYTIETVDIKKDDSKPLKKKDN
ncbi:MAG: hypothetical protein K9K32_00145 [Halanaerobiales bacterium]|nr:hypothetical protein [Halanaerobiales bacterium]